METISNDTAAKLMTLHDCVWQLGNTLRDCMNRLETIKETNPELCVERETAQAKHTLERYAKGPMFYKPHPFGWPFDAYVLRDALAKFAPSDHEIQVPPAKTPSPLKTLLAATAIITSGDGWVDELCEQVPCEILGCGKTASEAQMRTFRLGDAPVKCCPECWDAMEIPRDCRDTADLSQHNAKSDAPT